jgi:hypothetical protein
MLNLTRLHLGIAHESQFQGLGISALLRSEEMTGIRKPSLDAPAIDIANRYQVLTELLVEMRRL